MEEIEYCLGITNAVDRKHIISTLSSAGLRCTGESKDCSHFLRTVRTVQPQLTILSLDLKGDVLETASIIEEEALAALLLISKDSPNRGIFHKTEGISSPIIRFPLENSVLLAVIEVIYQEYVRRKKLVTELKSLRNKLQSRTVIERAKGIIMKELSIDEQSAYRFLQKKSMDLRLPLKKYAERIIAGK